jgi:hypothetical protein
MDDKKTMTLNLTAREMEVLEELSARKEMTKTAVMKHALRLYQMVDAKLAEGAKLFLEDEKANKKAELMVL